VSSLFQTIPGGWKRTTLRHLAQGPKNGAWGSEAGEDEVDAVCVRVADFDWSRLALKLDDPTTRSFKKQQFKNLQLLPGDIVIEKSGGGEKTPVGRVVSFDEGVEAVTSNFVARIRPHKDVWNRFFLYLLAAHYMSGYSYQFIKQNTGIQNLDDTNLFRSDVWVPDLATQHRIADFLDRETARIDLLIEKKQRLVALLGEKVRSDIDDLFQSLDAETWRIRHLGKVKNGAGFPVELQGDASNEIPFFKVKHLAVNGLDQRITESDDTITKETARTLRATVFPSGTIVFAKIGAALLLGRFSMLGVEGCIDNNLAAFVVNKRLVDPDYLLLCFERFEMQLMVQPGAVPSLSTEKFINQSVPLPSLDVQMELVERVRRAVKRNGRIVQRTETSIDRLKEYRSALITAAVTGQIDVTTYAKSGTTDRRLDAIQEEMDA
jgi:type I restriction enzyme, S subunit